MKDKNHVAWLLLIGIAFLSVGCVGTIIEGMREAGAASGLGGRKPTRAEIEKNYEYSVSNANPKHE